MASIFAELVKCWLMLLFAFVLGIGPTLLHGYHFSSVAAPSKFIKSFINDTWQHRYNRIVGKENLTLMWSSIVSVLSLGALFGSLISGFLIRKYGKRKCQLYNDLLIIGTSLIIGFSKMAGSFEIILIGRFLYGITSGFGLCVCVQFLGEIAPIKFRGLTNSSSTLFVTVGKVFGQVVGLSETLGTEDLWPLLLSISGITALVQLVVFPFFPDTPLNLLITKNDKEGCIKVMKKLWGEGDYQVEIEELIKEHEKRKNSKALTILQLLRDKSLRLQLGILLVLILALQFCGANAIYFYTYEVFQQAGFSDDRIPYISIGVGSCELLGCIFCIILIDKFGRRAILLSGYGVMSIALSLLTVTMSFQDSYSWVPECSVAIIFLYVFFFGMGPAGVTVVITIELLPYSARISGIILFNVVTWTAVYIVGMVFPYMAHSLLHFCFLIFLGVILISWTILFLFLPETKGKSLTEITEECQRLRCRQMCCQATDQEKQPEAIACTRL